MLSQIKAVLQALLSYSIGSELPDSLACVSLYNPSTVEVIVVWSRISWRQNTSRHRSGYVTSTLRYKDTGHKEDNHIFLN